MASNAITADKGSDVPLITRGGLPPRVGVPIEAPVTSIIVKLAARCNLLCDYCYWFRDNTVLSAPKLLSTEVERAFLERLRHHLMAHALSEMILIFHGGEPLLFGKRRFAELCSKLRLLEAETGTLLKLFVTTNGVLVDDEWAALFRNFRIQVSISLDGPAELHDKHRPDLRGRPTHSRTVEGLWRVRAHGFDPGILTVADPSSSPDELLAYLIDELGCQELDVLIPDATHEDRPSAIAPFYTRLFDLWFDTYSERGVRIRLFEAIVRGLCGYWSGVESIGYGPIGGVTLCTDGSLEAHDVCRIAGDGSTRSAVSVFTHEIDDVRGDALWREIWDASLRLAPQCLSCEWSHSCGGGHIASRWSPERRYDNPSVYCSDFKVLFSHIWDRISPTLYYEVET